MQKQYVYSVEDLESMLSLQLTQEIYDNYEEEEFVQVQQALRKYGENYVFVDYMATVSAMDDSDIPMAFQVITVIPNGYIVLIHSYPNEIKVYKYDKAEDVLKKLLEFVNLVKEIDFEQVDALNTLVGNLKNLK